MKNLKYSDILKSNKELELVVSKFIPYNIKVISNIITSQFKDIFEYVLRNQQINASVTFGDYDNILQDALKFSSSSTVIIFWELSNLVDGLQYKAETMGKEEIDSLIEKTKNEVDFVFKHLEHSPNVILNKFSSLVFNYSFIKENSFERIGNILNDYISEKLPSNFTLIDIDKIFAKLSIEKSVDFRYYYSSKSLYSIEFYKEYSSFIAPIVFSLLSKTKKAFIFDCDNTLWKGVVGEDGVNGIELSVNDKNGRIFEEVHFLIRDLSKQGVLIGLCSKNNLEDVEEVFLKRIDFELNNEDILIKKINWNDKVNNLREIAEELNIGIDSLVFIDDSSFEVDFVRKNLPEVTSLEVGDRLYIYPSILRENFKLFYKKNYTKEDKDRSSLYRTEENRKIERSKFSSLDQYLLSLELKIEIYINDSSNINRVAQLTQKTNQFNFTTYRYTESNIEEFNKSKNHIVYVFGVTDKFGDYGITGMAIIHLEGHQAEIGSFLMSCRVIGRNIEIAFLNFILKDLQKMGIEIVLAKYISTMKNMQLKSFYDDFGFALVADQKNVKEYTLKLKDHQFQNVDYITLKISR
jgi:FkbH-like protein